MQQEYVFLDECPKEIQKKLNQWRHQYNSIILHNPRYYSEINTGAGTRHPRMMVMVERWSGK